MKVSELGGKHLVPELYALRLVQNKHPRFKRRCYNIRSRTKRFLRGRKRNQAKIKIKFCQ